MIGLPASGKSSIAKKIAKSEDAVIVSSDDIRKELGNINDQSKNEKVFEIAEKRLKNNINER
jgi:predicted kinase